MTARTRRRLYWKVSSAAMSDHVVTARGRYLAYPYIIATDPHQIDMLADLAMYDPQRTGIAARDHYSMDVYVWDRPVGFGQSFPGRYLRIGYFARFGGAMFADETRDRQRGLGIALRPAMLYDTPTVYYEMESKTAFPPRCVMPVNELREVVLEWATTGKRPTCVEWLTVNDLIMFGDRSRCVWCFRREPG